MVTLKKKTKLVSKEEQTTSGEPKKRTRRKKLPEKQSGHCLEGTCTSEAVQEGYCRLHYIANWRAIKFNKQVKNERRLNAYIDKLKARYPNEYMNIIREGLENEDKFQEMIEELEVESSDYEKTTDNEFLEKFMREIKGVE